MVTTCIEIITPERAKVELESASMLNRRLSKIAIRRYAEDILRDGYPVNGQPVIYNGDGKLVDGFHRLHAILLAKKAIQTVVVRGVESIAVATIDSGRGRNLADNIVMSGVGKASESRVLAGAARIVQGYVTKDGLWMERGRNTESSAILLDFIRQTPNLQKCLKVGMEVGKIFKKSFQSARATALYYILREKSGWEADMFFEMLKTGKVPDPDSPIVTLRERLYAETNGKYIPSEREMMAVIIKTWNAFRSGSKVGHLAFRKNEKFPEIL